MVNPLLRINSQITYHPYFPTSNQLITGLNSHIRTSLEEISRYVFGRFSSVLHDKTNMCWYGNGSIRRLKPINQKLLGSEFDQGLIHSYPRCIAALCLLSSLYYADILKFTWPKINSLFKYIPMILVSVFCPSQFATGPFRIHYRSHNRRH